MWRRHGLAPKKGSVRACYHDSRDSPQVYHLDIIIVYDFGAFPNFPLVLDGP